MSEQTPQDQVDAIGEKHAAKGREKTAIALLRDTLQRSLPELQRAMPQTLIADQFVRVLLTTVQRNPYIATCSPQSIVGAAFEAAALGLMIDGVLGHAYLVPFRDNKKQVVLAQLMIGYRGFCELAYRSGRVANISARTVHENDTFEYEEGVKPVLIFRKKMNGDRGARIAAFAVAHWTSPNIPPSFEVLTAEDVEQRRLRSKGKKDSSPWITDPDAMWAKSAIRALAKALPQCPDVTRAALIDELRDYQIARPSHIGGTVIDGDAVELGEG